MAVATGACVSPTLKECSAESAKEDITTSPSVKVSIFKDKVKGALSRIISISLHSQSIYLCHRKPTNNGLYFVNNWCISALKLLESVFGCRWPGLQLDKLRLNF